LDGICAVGCGPGKDYPSIHIFQCMLERTDAITNVVLRTTTFVLAYPAVFVNFTTGKHFLQCYQVNGLRANWKIVRRVRICTGPMGIQIRKDARGSLSPCWLWKILLPCHSKHPQTATCNGHISFPLSHQLPQE
jgi:hypothetical protein